METDYIDLDAAKLAQPVVDHFDAAGLPPWVRVKLEEVAGIGETKWEAADDLLTTIQVQIERLKILEEKAQALCIEYAGGE